MAILPGWAVTFSVAVNPTETSIVVINDNGDGKYFVVMHEPLYIKVKYKKPFLLSSLSSSQN